MMIDNVIEFFSFSNIHLPNRIEWQGESGDISKYAPNSSPL